MTSPNKKISISIFSAPENDKQTNKHKKIENGSIFISFHKDQYFSYMPLVGARERLRRVGIAVG
jgi:hypothetical protein